MLKTLRSKADGETQRPWASTGMGATQGLRNAASALYRQMAALASALGPIERELQDSLNWLHDGHCVIAISAYTSYAANASSCRRALSFWRSWTRSTRPSLSLTSRLSACAALSPSRP
jgi:hypothetical protein